MLWTHQVYKIIFIVRSKIRILNWYYTRRYFFLICNAAQQSKTVCSFKVNMFDDTYYTGQMQASTTAHCEGQAA